MFINEQLLRWHHITPDRLSLPVYINLDDPRPIDLGLSTKLDNLLADVLTVEFCRQEPRDLLRFIDV